MKKVILICSTIAFVTALSIVGCKKELRPKEEEKTNTELKTTESQPSNPLARFSDNISVSQYGFLIFPKIEDSDDYFEFLMSSTHGEVQEYLNSIAFNSLGETLYGEQYWNERVTEEQAINYVFNEDKIFQIENVIMKPINEVVAEVKWEFLLTMVPNNLSALSYESMASGTYDGSTMNKFATNPDDESLVLSDFIKDTPSGYEETVANSEQARRPFWGSGDWVNTTCTLDDPNNWTDHDGDGDTDPTYQQCRKRKKYRFWIGFGSQSECSPAYSCN